MGFLTSTFKAETPCSVIQSPKTKFEAFSVSKRGLTEVLENVLTESGLNFEEKFKGAKGD